MSGKIFNRVILPLAMMFAIPVPAWSDGGASTGNTPYSIYGIGELTTPGSAYNRTMAGSGVALRDHKYINILNPASVSARDSLSFMLDFSVNATNKVLCQEIDGNKTKTAKNSASIGDIFISFPVLNKLAMYAGISQFSSVGFSYKNVETDPLIINTLGYSEYSYSGTGGLYQISAGIGNEFFKRLAIGAEADFIFGQISNTKNLKFSKTSVVGISENTYKDLNSFTGKFGIQYLQPIGSKFKFGLGATYRLASDLKGEIEDYTISTTTDTTSCNPDGIRLSDEIVAGISLHFADKVTVTFDWSRSDWSASGFDNAKYFSVNGEAYPFKSTVSQSYRIGAEYIPNKTDVRYYLKRAAYRAGFYWKNDYFTVGDKNINAWGVTLGTTLPVFRWYNGVTVGFEFGQRGVMKQNLVAERFFNFTLAVNMFDIWFQKPRYE